MLTRWLEHQGLAALAPRITFDQPAWLLLLPVLWALTWSIARRSLSGWDGPRRTVLLLLRCAVIGLLVAALARPHVRWRTTDVAVVAVVDVSASVPQEQKRLAGEFLAASLAKRSPRDRLGLVTVARDAIVHALPTAGEVRLDTGVAGPSDASHLQEGIDLAQALIPADAGGRVLLISDGNETAGSLTAAAARLTAAGVPIDVAAVEYDRSTGVRLEEVVVPPWVRDGDTITARIVLAAGEPASGRLTLLLNGEAVDLDPDSPALSAHIHLEAGVQALLQPLTLPSGPVHRIEAVFEPDDSEGVIPQLLRVEGLTFTSDRGRVLVLAEDTQAAAPLVEALSSDAVRLEVRPAREAPQDLAEWSGYDTVVLVDQPAASFSQAQQQDLARYVHDAGGGLLVIGGPDSYGAGGWIGSPLADALPVHLDPPQKRQMPMGALAIILDCSGSMASLVSDTGLTQQQIANEAAILGVRALSRRDQIAVVAFSGDAQVVVPLTPCSDPDGIARRIRSIGPGGGTNLFPAIDAAAAELAKSAARVKHIIILTDGQTVGNPREGIAKAAQLARGDVTISTVAIGDQSNDGLLYHLAKVGGGRFHSVRSQDSRAVLPQIFIKEAQTVRRSLIWEGPAFTPTLAQVSESVRGLAAPLPAITGYIVTADRGGFSLVPLRGPQGDPILAQWQHGLGRVTAYTSDATTRWNAAWTSWASYRAFWSQQLKWVMRPGGDPGARVTVDTRGEKAKVVLELLDGNGERVNFASIRARVAPPASSGAGDSQPRDVAFRQVGPGRYEAEVEATEAGAHPMWIRYEAAAGEGGNGERRSGTVRAAIVRHAGEEYRRPTPDTHLLGELARRSGGRVYRLDPAGANLWVREQLKMPESSRPVWLLLALAAVAAFLGDIAARRIAIDPARIRERLVRLSTRPPETVPASLATLAAAKARATAAAEPVQVAPTPPSAALTSEPVDELPARVELGSPTSAPSPQPPAPPSAPPQDDVMARLRAAKRRSLPDRDDPGLYGS